MSVWSRMYTTMLSNPLLTSSVTISQYPPVTITELRPNDFHIVSSYDLHLVACCIHRRLDAVCSGLTALQSLPSCLHSKSFTS